MHIHVLYITIMCGQRISHQFRQKNMFRNDQHFVWSVPTQWLLKWPDRITPLHDPSGQGFKAAQYHDDVIEWKHFPRNWPFVRGIHRSPVNSPHKGQWPGALMFTLICARINGWVNTREAGDLRRYYPHYDVIVMTRLCEMCRWSLHSLLPLASYYGLALYKSRYCYAKPT